MVDCGGDANANIGLNQTSKRERYMHCICIHVQFIDVFMDATNHDEAFKMVRYDNDRTLN